MTELVIAQSLHCEAVLTHGCDSVLNTFDFSAIEEMDSSVQDGHRVTALSVCLSVCLYAAGLITLCHSTVLFSHLLHSNSSWCEGVEVMRNHEVCPLRHGEVCPPIEQCPAR